LALTPQPAIRSSFFALQSHQVDGAEWWLRPLLEEFERRTDGAHPDDVLDQARNAECQLWGYWDGSFRGLLATQIRTSRKGSSLLIWICVGVDALELVSGVMQTLEAWAREMGCTKVQIVGRKGWERVLTGFESKSVVLEKTL
jgi:hypothetical protein